MPQIHVCSLDRLAADVARLRASHVVTLLREPPVPTPAGVAPADHLRLAVNDITMPQDGLVHPDPEHIEALLGFVRRWDQRSPIVIHCFAGISRSTAACLISLCALAPAGREAELAAEVRRRSPTAMPNSLMIRHADRILGRSGRLVRAVDDMGRGAEAASGTPFTIPIASF